MRLTEFEHQSIKDVFLQTFKNGTIYLFGSRLDDTKRGGDIDLYIETTADEDLFDKKIEFLVELKTLIGDQKIDVIISKDQKRSYKNRGKIVNINQEKIENKPFIDILNRPEKLGLLETNNWGALREARNELAHNYDDEPKEMAEAINKVYNKKEALISIYHNIKNYYLQYANN